MSTRLSLISPNKPRLYSLYQILNSYVNVNSPFITELFNGKMFLRIYLPINNISSTIKSLMNKGCLICYPNQGNTQAV